MMPGLPNTTKEQDIKIFEQLFSLEDYRPDSLKIYPCLVMPGTQLFTQYKKGLFKPISTREAAEIISECKRFVPEYCRIMRVNRDIPSTKIESISFISAGATISLKLNCLLLQEETNGKSTYLTYLSYHLSRLYC